MLRVKRKRHKLPKGRLLGVVRFQDVELHATVIDNQVYLDIHEVGALVSWLRGTPLEGGGRNKIGDALRESGTRLIGRPPRRFCPEWKKSHTSGYTLEETLDLLNKRKPSSDHAAATALQTVFTVSQARLGKTVADAYAAALEQLLPETDTLRLFLGEVTLKLAKLTEEKANAIRSSGQPCSSDPC